MNFKIKMLLLSVIGLTTYANSIDHIQNYSSDYLANQAQTGKINVASVYYNPAALTNLESGFYLHGGVQVLAGRNKFDFNYKNSFDEDTSSKYDGDSLKDVKNIASLYVDKKHNIAFFTTLGKAANDFPANHINKMIPKYENIEKDNLDFNFKNSYLQGTLGVAYQLNNKLSTSVAVKVVGANVLQSVKDDIDEYNYKTLKSTYGTGFQLGVNYKLNEKINLGLKYDSQINLPFDDVKITNGGSAPNNGKYLEFKEDSKFRRDLPAVLSLGISSQINEKLNLSASSNIYFNKRANIDDALNKALYNKEKLYNNGFDFAIGSEYKLNDSFDLMASASYSNTGATKLLVKDFALNSIGLGTGLRFTSASKNTQILLALHHSFFNSKEDTLKTIDNKDGKIKFERSLTTVGLSITKKF